MRLDLVLVPLSVAGLSAAVAMPNARLDARSLRRRGPDGEKKVIAQMFGWNWNSIGTECRDFLGPQGYGFVQVSPPSEHVAGPEWWTDYQPVSYNLISKRGNREQFKAMIDECRKAGVGVIVDTIFNHMAGIDEGTGVGGSTFTHYLYDGTYQPQDFHYCDLTEFDDVEDYTSREQIQFCELSNLADLATETDYVRRRLSEYANDLLSLGAVGLRLDAAKHIPVDDVDAILSRLTDREGTYITQEVIFGAGEPVLPNEYETAGDVQELRYTFTLKDAFEGRMGGLAELQSFENRGWVNSDAANVYVANHDTERNNQSLNTNSPNNAYVLAHVFSLAHPYGTPTVLSGYSFADYDAGAPNNGEASCSSADWRCEHRNPAISGMVGFHNEAGSEPLTNWHSPSGDRIAFGRGNFGFVAINNADNEWTETFRTSLPAGTYCDAAQNARPNSSGGCSTGNAYTVASDGTFTATVGGRGAVAIYSGMGTSGAGDGKNSAMSLMTSDAMWWSGVGAAVAAALVSL